MSWTGALRQLLRWPVRRRRPNGRMHRLKVESLEARIVPSFNGNQLFPMDNPWNEKITSAPVLPNSATLVASIGLTSNLHPDFGAAIYNGGYIGIPINTVAGTQPKINVVLDAYADQSDHLPIPIPANAILEGDPAAVNTTDRHLLVYDKDNNLVYETFNTHRPTEEPDGQWHADSEAVWYLNQDYYRPAGWTSADAAGLPILPGLVRPDEVLDQHAITHALRFTVPHTENQYVFPASHEAGSANSAYPRMGERFRLKASFDISGYSTANRVILQALKDYGMIVADNGSGWYLSGQPSSRWSDSDLHNLNNILGSSFEAVDANVIHLTPVVAGLSVTTGLPAGGTLVTINGSNFTGGSNLQVFFGTTPATGVTLLSDTQITAAAPSHVAGTVDVLVQTSAGASASVDVDRFYYGTTIAASSLLVTGADAGGGPEVRVLTITGVVKMDFFAYNVAFTGGVRVASGDVTGDGVPDIVTAPGPGGGPDVRVFDGVTGQLVREMMAYNPAFLGGISIAVGDTNGDGFGDIITGADAGGGPHVQVFSGKDGSLLQSFYAYITSFTGGVRVAAGDINGDGKADIITAPGFRGGPDVRVYSGATGALIQEVIAYAPAFTGGVYVAAGDTDGDGRVDIITGPGVGGGPNVRVFRGMDGTMLQNFMAYDPAFTGGVRVGVTADLTGKNRMDIVTAAGPGGGPHVEVFDGVNLAALDSFFAYDPRFTGGVYVGGH